MNAQKHKELLEQYLQNGGNRRLADSVRAFSLQNYAKLKYELEKLEHQKPKLELKSPNLEIENQQPQAEKRSIFKELIIEYPTELHHTYRRRWEVWLELCSWKVRLNEIPEKETKQAFEIQWIIHLLFQEFDKCQNILKHYKEHKRIMLPNARRDFSEMTELELYKELNNLRALICRRKQTIEKMENELEGTEPTPRQLHAINLKKEQLQEKTNELLEIEKILNNGK